MKSMWSQKSDDKSDTIPKLLFFITWYCAKLWNSHVIAEGVTPLGARVGNVVQAAENRLFLIGVNSKQ